MCPADETARSANARGARWYAVHTRPHCERRVCVQLDGQGFRSFLPLRLKSWRHARRFETRLAPVFPRYLFVLLDLDRDRWRSVNGTHGVHQLVMGGEERPAPVPVGVVESLQAMTDARGCLLHEGRLRVGERVRVLAGPLVDQVGELIQLDGAGRVRVLLELLGGRIPVLLPHGRVAPAC